MDIWYGLALSLHLGMEGNYNFIHPNVGLEWDNFIAGAYYNSVNKISLFGALKLDISEKVKAEIGVVSGYSDHLDPALRVNYMDYFLYPSYTVKDDGEKDYGIVIGKDWRF